MTNLLGEQSAQPSLVIDDGAEEQGTRFLATRTAERHAAFFLPHLRAGMDLLDCGCGPGSITLGLAGVVAPGGVVGIDRDPQMIAAAQRHATPQRAPNLRFETADIQALPFPDGAFDAVYSNAVLLYIPDPLAALREIQRVLKPGGVVGIRSPDHAALLCAPTDPLLTRFWQLWGEGVAQAGGHPNQGRHLGALLHQTGFVRLEASASYDCFGTPEATRQLARINAHGLAKDRNFVQQLVASGLTEPAELERIRQAWLAWGEDPAAFAALAYGEVVGWKEG